MTDSARLRENAVTPPLVKISALSPGRSLPLYRVRWARERIRDRCGRWRHPITCPGYGRGQKPANAGKKYPADPPTPDEVLRLLAACSTRTVPGRRNRALIVLLWRSGLRISEALALVPLDLDSAAGTIHVRRGKGGKARRVGMDPQAFAEIAPWLEERRGYPSGPVFCSVEGPSAGGPMGSSYFRTFMRRLAAQADVDRRCAPHQLRHALAVGLAREGVGVNLIQRELGHSNLGTTATYLAGISNAEVVEVIQRREWPGGPS